MLSRAVMPLCKSAAAQGNDALFIAKVDLCFYFGFLLIFCLILLPDKISKLPNKYYIQCSRGVFLRLVFIVMKLDNRDDGLTRESV